MREFFEYALNDFADFFGVRIQALVEQRPTRPADKRSRSVGINSVKGSTSDWRKLGDQVNRRTCNCRKPASGMIEQAIRELSIDPTQSILIDDKLSDFSADRAAGIKQDYLVSADVGLDEIQGVQTDGVSRSLPELAASLLGKN